MTAQENSDNQRRFSLLGQQHSAPPLPPALYIVSTPIGNLGDLTVRAIETLAATDLIACEDTRVSRVLLNHYGITTRLTTYHEHNAPGQRPKLLAALARGESVALISDAGTPLISDPGFRLVAEAALAGHTVVPLPGASALLAATVVSGLATDTLLFAGFLPSKKGARHKRIDALAAIPATLVFYESPHRISAALADLCEILGGSRPAAVGRELTKKFETVRRGTLAELTAAFGEHAVKGEIVIVVGPPAEDLGLVEIDIDAALREALSRAGAGAAASEVAKATGRNRRELYQRAIELTSQTDDDDT